MVAFKYRGDQPSWPVLKCINYYQRKTLDILNLTNLTTKIDEKFPKNAHLLKLKILINGHCLKYCYNLVVKEKLDQEALCHWWLMLPCAGIYLLQSG